MESSIVVVEGRYRAKFIPNGSQKKGPVCTGPDYYIIGLFSSAWPVHNQSIAHVGMEVF